MNTSLVISLHFDLDIVQLLFVCLVVAVVVIVELFDHFVLGFGAQLVGNDGGLQLDHGIEMHFLFGFA